MFNIVPSIQKQLRVRKKWQGSYTRPERIRESIKGELCKQTPSNAEERNICFGLKQCQTTLHLKEISKYESGSKLQTPSSIETPNNAILSVIKQKQERTIRNNYRMFLPLMVIVFKVFLLFIVQCRLWSF